MVADADFSDYLQARWPVLVAALEAEGVPPDAARLAVADVLVAHRRDWRRLVAEENVDVRVWQAAREHTGLPPRPGSAPPVTSVAVDASQPVDDSDPWMERAETRRRARRWKAARRWGAGLVAAAVVVAGLVWWGVWDRAPAVRQEANPLPVVWYAGDELHLEDVVVELPDLHSFVSFGEGAAVRRRNGEVVQVHADGAVSPLADTPTELLFAPQLPDYLPFGRFTSVVQGAPASGGRWAYVLDSRRRDSEDSLQIPVSAHRILVLCDAAGVCQQAESGIPAEDFRLR